MNLLLSIMVVCATLSPPTTAQQTECPALTETFSSTSYPTGDIRNCLLSFPGQPDQQPVYAMEVLPGGGFDSLRNLDMGQVHVYTYRGCQKSLDGKYLLPDDVFVIPLKQSKLDMFAEYFDHWDNYTDMIAASINIGGWYENIAGKFSSGYSDMKTRQVNEKSKSTRVQIRHKLYTVKLQPGAQLHPSFKSALLEIADNIHNNNSHHAGYLAELLVRDYGTHFVTSVQAGAILAKTDQIKSSYAQNNNRAYIKVAARADFFGLLQIGASFMYSKSDEHSYGTNITHSEITSHGGPPLLGTNFSLAGWEKGIADALVAIDRSGDPLHFAINSDTLPDLPEITIKQLSKTVDTAISRYYRANTRHGCTVPDSKNFNFQANVDDKTCQPPETNSTFGGVYQMCTNLDRTDICDSIQQRNPLTGDYSCPTLYTAVSLHNGTVTMSNTVYVCSTWCFLFLCHETCQNVKTLQQARYQAYWCAALGSVPPKSGYLFGGFYTSRDSNPVTGAKNCPKPFTPLHFLEDVTVCVSEEGNADNAYANSILFGGFQSCKAGNPLANGVHTTSADSWLHDCPTGHNPHLLTVDEGCEINFCIHSGNYTSTSLLPVKLPPFQRHHKHKVNVTKTLSVVGTDGEIWFKNETGTWYKNKSDINDGESLVKMLYGAPSDDARGQGLSGGEVATLTILCTVLLGALVLVMGFAGHCIHKRRKRLQGLSEYTELRSSGNVQTNITEERA